MLVSRSTRDWTAWIALWSLVLGTVMPAGAHVLVSGSAGAAIEICSATGIVRVTSAAPGDHREGSTGVDYSQHCPWCTLHGGMDALPPTPALALGLPALHAGAVALALDRGVIPAPSWQPSTARAPPQV